MEAIGISAQWARQGMIIILRYGTNRSDISSSSEE